MANILPIVDPTNDNPSSGSTPPPKLALFSGHDTTLMPILATLGDKVWSGTDWAPYASMIQLEIHEIMSSSDLGPDFPSGYAFRLVYNGQVLTSKMDGCAADSELCDSQVLVKQVMPFAKYMDRECASQATSIAPSGADDDMMTEMKTATENLITAPGGVWVVVLLVILSMLLGSVMTCFLMRRQMRRYRQYRRESLAMGDMSMTVMEDDAHHSSIDSAISTKYGATHEDEKKYDENSLI